VGDCLTHLATLADESVDLVVTSPPYNIGIVYRSYADRLPRDAYLAWMQDIANDLHRVLKRDGAIFLNLGSTNIDPWLAIDVAQVFRHSFILQNHITWVKSISIGDDTVGHFKPIRSKRFLNQNHEAIFHLSKTGTVNIDRLAIGVAFKDKTNIRRRGHAQDRRCAGNVWFLPYDTVRSKAEKFDHPAGFPLALPQRCIALHGMTEGVILDPFLGAGTTLVAAAQAGHRGIGIELDPVYAQTAFNRLAKMRDFHSSNLFEIFHDITT
jgi:site-specific DNA-methyltransferase (adenine-specific)